jgi:hypothetical protein
LQSPHRAAAHKTFSTTNFLLLNDIWPIERISMPKFLPRISETLHHSYMATTQSKKEMSNMFFLLRKQT